MQKRPVGVFILGWMILLSNILLLSYNIFRLFAHKLQFESTLFASAITAVAISPSEFTDIFLSLSTPWLIINFVGLAWAAMTIACGLGILLRNNLMRVWFIVLNIINIMSGLCVSMILPILSGKPRLNVYLLCALLMSIVYAAYFSHPKIKEYFRKDKGWLDSDKAENRLLLIFVCLILALNIVYIFIPKTPTFQFPDGSLYKGMIKQEKMHGKGLLIWPTGEKYEGDWRWGVMNGYGVFTWENGDMYTGYFKNNKMHGKGTFLFKNGDKYIGEFKDGKREGTGEYIWRQGKKHYKGQFEDNKICGPGELIVIDEEGNTQKFAVDKKPVSRKRRNAD